MRQILTATLPAAGPGNEPRSSLEEAIDACRSRGGSPQRVRVASPFFDANDEAGRVTVALCKSMARGEDRELQFCIPAVHDGQEATIPRLAAPRTLLDVPHKYGGEASIQLLPELDEDQNRRAWHAKMLMLSTDEYAALMIGSSNFTCAGMGVDSHRNAEVNILTIVDRDKYSREVGDLEAAWPEMEEVDDPESAEWLGAQPELDEEDRQKQPPLPRGFLLATFRGGEERQIILNLDVENLPTEWSVHACGPHKQELVSSATWKERGGLKVCVCPWTPLQPPDRLLVCWEGCEAFMPLNVEDSSTLPPPALMENMSAEDMLWILAAADPGAAFRAWARQQQPPDQFDPDLDSATPIDLDPLRRYDLQTTFLHRVRRRARILAQLRANLQRPVWGTTALEWRLRGLIGVEPLAHKFLREYTEATDRADEALLTLADLLIVLSEVEYQPTEGSLPKAAYEKVFRPFLQDLTAKLASEANAHRDHVSEELFNFWDRVVERCRK